MHTDDDDAWIADGSRHQDETVMEAITLTAAPFADGGYAVVVDGIVAPWFLGPWRAFGRPLSDLGPLEHHVTDSSDMTPGETASALRRRLDPAELRLGA